MTPGAERPLRVLMLGLGSVGQRHARNLRTLLGDRVELLACRSRGLRRVIREHARVEENADLEREYELTVFSSLDEALARQPDVAVIATPSSLHVSAALACARAGCHLFIEKPLSDSLVGVEELIAEVAQRKRVAAIGCQMRFHPCLELASIALREGAIGRVLAMRVMVGEHLPGWHPYEDYRESYASRRDLGGGVVLTLIHELDYAQWLVGMPSEIYALGGHWSPLEIDVEDVASMLLRCADATGHPIAVHVQMDYVQQPPVRSCDIAGTEGRIAVDLRNNTFEMHAAGRLSPIEASFPELERNEMFLAELRHFLGAIDGAHPPAVSLRDAAGTLAVAIAAKESMRTGAVVRL
ncbi:MAG: Gfo/Idh/MocA family oxidoreductase [Gemmatimonadota bacterium]|nr:Gfo/Idh/MocA family oxidoreductase [Gemmatimonadota bacterium]